MTYPIKCDLHPVVRRMLIELCHTYGFTQVAFASSLLNQSIVTLYKAANNNDSTREVEPEGTDAVVGGQSVDSDALADSEASNDSASTAG